MRRATDLADALLNQPTRMDRCKAAALLRQQEAVIKRCVEALEDAHYTAERHQDVIKREAAMAAAKECLK